jgi:hypothetical protein
MDERLDEKALVREALRRIRPRRRVPLPGSRQGMLIVLSLVLGAGLFLAYRAAASGLSVADVPLTSPTATEPVRHLADTVTFAVAAFDLRAALFRSHKMGCPDLAGGLVELEDRWMAYSAARKSAATTADAAPLADDRRLHDGVDAAEREFTRTGCPRP